MAIRFSHRGSFDNIERLLRKAKNSNFRSILERYAREGVSALVANTPQDSGLTADSWDYKITITRNGFEIAWINKNVNDGLSIPILIQYGHATRSGGFVEGRDFINPAMKPIFEKIVRNLFEEVSNL